MIKTETNMEVKHPHEYEQASNSYLMAVVSVIAGMPLPIINLIAAVGYYMGNRKSSYFVRWHCIQSVFGQALVLPFNSIAFAWTLGIILKFEFTHHYNEEIATNFTDVASPAYFYYIFFIVILNLIDFIAVIFTAVKVRKGDNVRWPVISLIADRLTSKENRDIYTI